MGEVIDITDLTAVGKKPSILDFEVVSKPVIVDDRPVAGKKAIVRADTGDVLSITGAEFGIVQNEEFFGTLETAFGQLDLNDWTAEDRISENGLVCYRDYSFPGTKVKVPDGSRADINYRVLARNSHGKFSMEVITGAIDWYCKNGMVSGKTSGKLTPHSKHASVREFNEIVSEGFELYGKEVEKWTGWMNTEIAKRKVHVYLKRHFGDRQLPVIEDLVSKEFKSRGNTVWAVYSALTAWATHREDIKNKKEETEATARVVREEKIKKLVDSSQLLKLAA